MRDFCVLANVWRCIIWRRNILPTGTDFVRYCCIYVCLAVVIVNVLNAVRLNNFHTAFASIRGGYRRACPAV